jgi:Uncharacterised nucleotidyltransferase
MMDSYEHAVSEPRSGGDPQVAADALWRCVDDVIERSPSSVDLRAHRLHLLAAQRFRALGQPIPEEFAVEERLAAAVTLAAEITLERARACYDGTLVLMKGLEVARRYPSPTLRPFRDLDLLVDRPEQAQRALTAAGFVSVGMDDRAYEDKHHLRPLRLPGLPVLVELHRRPVWISWGPPPSTAELLSDAVDSATGIPGVLALSPAHHALVLAAHSWEGTPLRRILDLIDITVVAREADPTELWDGARRWRMDGVWRTMTAAADAVLFGAPALPWHVRLWAGSPERARDRSMVRDHAARLLSPFSVLPPGEAFGVAADAVGRTVGPVAGEPWRVKAARMRRALRNAFERVSVHNESLRRDRL